MVLCSRSQGKLTEAVTLLRDSIRFGPHFADAYSSLASLYAEQVKRPASLVSCNTAEAPPSLIPLLLLRNASLKPAKFIWKASRTVPTAPTCTTTTACSWWILVSLVQGRRQVNGAQQGDDLAGLVHINPLDCKSHRSLTFCFNAGPGKGLHT